MGNPDHCCGWPRRTATRRGLFWALASSGAITGLYAWGNRPAAVAGLVLLALAYLIRWELDRRADRIAEQRARFWSEQNSAPRH